ncbi:MAG: PHP domain-containing protein [Desulfovibrionaceae bacterium]|nr:PHP domain-containing protein [Desulfovibrionaceae bacterium]MBF0514043.1 PHP domain-containing protein [Desulfovibrionaceae bacterium]
MAFVDLHTHSTASDGSNPPGVVARLAARAGLAAVALTDHDTVDGLEEFLAAGREAGVEAIPGCELSVEGEGAGIHILGLWVPAGPSLLSSALAELREHRHTRNRKILEQLARAGIRIDYEEVQAKAGGAVGRPHIAEAIIDRGVCRSFSECFDKYLGSRGLAYVPKKTLTAAEALGLLRRVGATPVLAHPIYMGLSMLSLEKRLRAFMDLGLEAIEAYYADHAPSQTAAYLELAGRLNLGVSGGSDFHGAPKPESAIGAGRGDLRVPYAVLGELKARRRALGLTA